MVVATFTRTTKVANVPSLTDSSDRDADAIVQRHIRLLHTYNEIKDGTQALIGKVSW
jgi:hypothetical protein